MKPYFNVFNLPETASLEDVKGIYKEMAKQYHPDKNYGSRYSSDLFRFVKEAYEKIEEFIKIEERTRPKRKSGAQKQPYTQTYYQSPKPPPKQRPLTREERAAEWLRNNPPPKPFSDPIFKKKPNHDTYTEPNARP